MEPNEKKTVIQATVAKLRSIDNVIYALLYMLIIGFTNLSVVGFWTDAILIFLSFIILFKYLFRLKTYGNWLTVPLKLLLVGTTLIAFLIFIFLTFIFIRSYDEPVIIEFKLYHVYHTTGNQNHFGGVSTVITESFILFPFIEWYVYDAGHNDPENGPSLTPKELVEHCLKREKEIKFLRKKDIFKKDEIIF